MGLPFWIITPLSLILLASVWIINSSLKLGYESSTSHPNLFFIYMNYFCSMSIYSNLTLVEHNLVKGYNVCARLCPQTYVHLALSLGRWFYWWYQSLTKEVLPLGYLPRNWGTHFTVVQRMISLRLLLILFLQFSAINFPMPS